MIIYGASLSPFVRKVLVVAAEKGIEVELRAANRAEPSPEFQAASPFNKMPAMRDGDFALADSSAIIAYLDAKHPNPSLIPADPQERGRAIWFDEFADTICAAAGVKILFNRLVGPKFFGIDGNEAVAIEGEAELARSYTYLETVVPENGFLLGGQFTLADIAVGSVLQTMTYVHCGEVSPGPRTQAWFDRLASRPSWQQVMADERAAMARRAA